jgi:hypothetical protein
VAVDSVSAAPPRGRRAHLKTLGFAAAGVGFSSLIFTGLIGAFKEETLVHFAFVLIVLVIASLVLLDRISEMTLGGHEERSSEKTGDRARLLIWSIGVAVLIVVLHRSIDTALKNDAEAIGQLLAAGVISSCVTAAWIFGARRRPARAARYGALAGVLIGGVLGVLISLFIFFVTDVAGINTTPPPGYSPLQQIIYRLVIVLVVGMTIPFIWGMFGFVGGLAIDRRWGSSPTRGILFALSLLAFPLSFGLFAYSYFKLQVWDLESLRIIFMAVGWGVGLILHGDVCDFTLDVSVPQAAEDPLHPVPPPPPRPKPNPVWEGLLIAGLSVTVLMLWHQTVVIKFFESDKSLPATSARRYQSKFAQTTTRVINFEMDVPKKLLPDGDFELQEIWNGPIGRITKADEAREGEEHPVGRYGWIDPGNWPPGTYTVELKLQKPGEKPEAGSSLGPYTFEIVGATFLPPPASTQPPGAATADLLPQTGPQPITRIPPALAKPSPDIPFPTLPDSGEPQPVNPQPVQPRAKTNAQQRVNLPQNSRSEPPFRPSQTVKPAEPQPVPMEVFMQNARTALASGHLISPQNDNALYWVRRARQISPQDAAAVQIEDMILHQGVRIVQNQEKAQNYDAALNLLSSLESLFPNHSDLRKLRIQIWTEQAQRTSQKNHPN